MRRVKLFAIFSRWGLLSCVGFSLSARGQSAYIAKPEMSLSDHQMTLDMPPGNWQFNSEGPWKICFKETNKRAQTQRAFCQNLPKSAFTQSGTTTQKRLVWNIDERDSRGCNRIEVEAYLCDKTRGLCQKTVWEWSRN